MITVCNVEVEYKIVNEVYLFDVRALIKLNWKGDLYFYKKWLKTNPPKEWNIDGVWYCEYERFCEFFDDNQPSKKGQADTIDAFVLESYKIRDLINPPKPPPEMIEKSEYDKMVDKLYKTIDEYEERLKNKDESYGKLKDRYDKLFEKSKRVQQSRTSFHILNCHYMLN